MATRTPLDQIEFIVNQKDNENLGWAEITKNFNKKFQKDLGESGVRMLYIRYGDLCSGEESHAKTLLELQRKKRVNSYANQEKKVALEYLETREDIIDTIKEVVNSIKPNDIKINKTAKPNKSKDNMTFELMLSDIHFGKKTEKVGKDELARRIHKVGRVVIDEIERESKNFNVERIVISMIGDIIENADFHGKESHKACEFGTSEQVFEAIKTLYLNIIIPIAKTGLPIDILCVTGNHDRLDQEKTYSSPGRHNLTFIIYKTLELMAERDGLKNVKFDISLSACATTQIYGNTLVIEHGDECKNMNRDSLNSMLSKRQTQLSKIIDFYRIGHFHEYAVYGQGRIMVNGSVAGQDSYSQVKGYNSEALQVLNYYIQTNKRPTCFFRSFPIYLDKK